MLPKIVAVVVVNVAAIVPRKLRYCRIPVFFALERFYFRGFKIESLDLASK